MFGIWVTTDIVCWVILCCRGLYCVYCKIFSSSLGLCSLDARELWQPFLVSRDGQMSLKGQNCPQLKTNYFRNFSCNQTIPSITIVLFFSFPSSLGFPVDHSYFLSALPHHSVSPKSGSWCYPLPKVFLGDQSDPLAAKSSKWTFLSSLIFYNFDTMASFYGIHLMYSFESPPIFLSPLDLLSLILSKYRDSTVYRTLLSAFPQFSFLLISLLVTAMWITSKYRFCLLAEL